MTRMLAVLAMFFVGVTPALIYPTVIHSLAQGRHCPGTLLSCIVIRYTGVTFDLQSFQYGWKSMQSKENRRISS